ncbi:MAG: winged helix-turn-helix domain-containing protein [Thermogemmatispora sp.]|nr:winged helix-turn-helix domain-containing protein [Thermogemmatispora sp.]MBE3567611.1 winged helix-turn-helix domain-containing protein [Thermogemmatispora sp.]
MDEAQSSRILLRSDLSFDPALAILQRQDKTILLTAREAAVLRALLQSPRCWHSADALASRLKRRWPHINAHSIEQIIVGLRRKLGESGKHPTILLSR